jgi:hypothetical protein
VNRAVLIALPLLALAVPAAAATTILPGYWESVNHVQVLMTKDSTDRKCITPEQVESYLSGPSNNHYTCTYTSRSVGGGAVHLAGQCVDSGVHFNVVLNGTYTPESFHLKAKLDGNLSGLPLSGFATTDAHRLSADCPAPAPKPADAAPSQ